jgi:hypothetical protein
MLRIDNTMVKIKRENNVPQSTTQKTKDRAKRIPLKTGWRQVLRKWIFLFLRKPATI